ncbi:MAG: hypothetical protein H7Z76_06030 [Methylotenera sp.]|nr:hypothetical protein [Flavobacterium sp.]
MSKSKLGNPFVVAAVVQKTADAIPFLIKLSAVIAVVVVGYRMYTNRFIKIREINSYGAANVSFAQAIAKADSIAKSKGVFTTDFDNVATQIAQLNYNGFVRVYNAFGNRTGTYITGTDLNLIEWFYNQFNDHEVSQLSLLLGGAFF